MRRRAKTGGGQTASRSPTKIPRKRRSRPTARRRAAVLSTGNEELCRQLEEAHQQQAATAEVLKVISRSAFDLQSVLDTLTESAARLCEADMACLVRPQDNHFLLAANYRFPQQFVDLVTAMPVSTGRGTLAGRVFAESRAVHISDAQNDPDYTFSDGQRASGFRSMLGVPLLRDGTIIGLFILTRKQVRPFTEKQIELVTTFADQAVIAIENVRLFEAEQQRTEQLAESLRQQTATAEVLKILSRSTFDLQIVLDTLTESACRHCEAYDTIIFLQQGGRLHVTAHYGPLSLDFTEWPISRSWITGRAFTDRVSIHVPDPIAAAEDFPDGSDMASRLGYRTILAVPLLREGEAIGALTIRRSEVRPFSAKQIELVETFANQAVIAIENTRLLNEQRQSLEQQTATADVLKVISRSTFDLPVVLQTLVESAARLCDADKAFITRERGGSFYRTEAYGFSKDFLDYIKDVPIHQERGSAAGRSLLEGRVIHIPDVTADPEYTWGEAQKRGDFRTIVAVPLLRQGAPIGVLILMRQEPRPFADKQIELLTTFADQAVIAIENARLLGELRESLQQQTATSDVLKVISRSAFDLQTVLQTLVESAAQLCDADKATITRQKGEFFYRAESYGFSTAFMDSVRDIPVVPERQSATGRALLEGKVIHIPDVHSDPDYQFGEALKHGEFRTILGVPMLREGVPIGVFALTRAEVRPFSQKQIELVSTFADQAAIAIENVRLFEQAETRTRELSESLEQQTATSEVLKVISRSPTNAQPVFDAICESASRMCEAAFSVVWRYDGDLLHYAASHNFTTEVLAELFNTYPKKPDRSVAAGRAILDSRIAHVPDMLADAAYARGLALAGNWRASIAVPMLRDGKPVGAISVGKAEAGPFSERQMQLLTTFADQAVIAIENARLFEAEQQRTQELARSLEDLRTAQDRLVQTQKLASLGQLTAGIAHEIKNPLNFVNNFSGLSVELIDELQDALKDSPLDGKARVEIDELADTLKSNLDKIAQHGKRADSIVKNMLLHSREGSGERRPVNVNALVEESLNLAYHGARAEKQDFAITLERAFDPEAGEAHVFPQDVTRVLLNLISNGFYAATKRQESDKEGYKPLLTTSTRNLGDSVEIRIRDNGTGITTEVKEKIFNPFFTTKPAGEGTGLGLSISHDIIVKQHAGAIEVDTEPGEFTEFRIILPRTAA
jgi:GAF domain-containing protein